MQRRVAPRLAFAVMLSTIIWTVSAAASVWYVDDDVVQSGAGASWDTAFKTVQEGINAAAAGDEVRVAQGLYDENIVVTYPKDDVSIYGGYIAGTSNRILFSDNGSVLDGGGRSSVVSIVLVNSTRIDGFTIRNGTAALQGQDPLTWGGGVISQTSNSVIISNNRILGNRADNGGGIALVNSLDVTISNNEISWNTANSWGGGIMSHDSTGTIQNNIVAKNTGWAGDAIYILGNYYGLVHPGEPVVANNTLVGVGSSNRGGVTVRYNATPIIANNIIAYFTYGVWSEAPAAPQLFHNDLFNAQNYFNASAGPGDIPAEPHFVDNAAGDYHLALNSPCIDNGSNAYVDNTWVDMDGEPRIMPVGGTVDIGADEDNQRPPEATSTDPLDGSTDIPLNRIITITFSEKLKVVPPENNIFLFDEKRLVPVSTTLMVRDKELTMTPAPGALMKKTTYSVTIPSFSIQDLAGNEMAIDKVFSFTTVDR